MFFGKFRQRLKWAYFCQTHAKTMVSVKKPKPILFNRLCRNLWANVKLQLTSGAFCEIWPKRKILRASWARLCALHPLAKFCRKHRFSGKVGVFLWILLKQGGCGLFADTFWKTAFWARAEQDALHLTFWPNFAGNIASQVNFNDFLQVLTQSSRKNCFWFVCG